jgi:hypothetical protein
MGAASTTDTVAMLALEVAITRPKACRASQNLTAARLKGTTQGVRNEQ